MNRFPKTEFLSLFSIILGLVGMALQSWLMSEMDSSGLLPFHHISGTVAFILLAVVVAVSFFFLKSVRPSETYGQMFPKSPIAGIGCILAGVGMAFSASAPDATGILQLLAPVLGIAAAGALAFAGFSRLQGRQPNCLLFALVAVALIVRTMLSCQKWSAETQVPLYFFPLLACLSLLLATYFRAELGTTGKNCRQYLFFRQLALYCCLVSMAGGDWLFYLSGAIWMATDFYAPAFYGKYAV